MSSDSPDSRQKRSRKLSVSFAELQSATRMLFDCTSDAETFCGTYRLSRYDELVIAELECSDIELNSATGQANSVSAQHVAIILIEHGELTLPPDFGDKTVGSGDIIIIDLARAFACSCKSMMAAWIFIPRVTLAIALGDPSLHLMHFPAEADSTRLLAAQMSCLLDIADGRSDTRTEITGQMFTASLSALLKPLRPVEAAMGFDRRDRSLLGRMSRFIETNLADPKLSVEGLGEAFNVSRATIFRLFHKHGGVAHYIRNVRLDRAFLQLSTNPYSEERLNVLANNYGFASGDSFARAFKERFGIRPIELRRGGIDATLRGKMDLLAKGGVEAGILGQWLIETGTIAERKVHERA